MTKEMLKEEKDIIKAEIFKKHYWNLIKNEKYKKVREFRNFFYHYFERKGKKSEYVFIMERFCKSIYDLTDEMKDHWE